MCNKVRSSGYSPYSSNKQSSCCGKEQQSCGKDNNSIMKALVKADGGKAAVEKFAKENGLSTKEATIALALEKIMESEAQNAKGANGASNPTASPSPASPPASPPGCNSGSGGCNKPQQSSNKDNDNSVSALKQLLEEKDPDADEKIEKLEKQGKSEEEAVAILTAQLLKNSNGAKGDSKSNKATNPIIVINPNTATKQNGSALDIAA